MRNFLIGFRVSCLFSTMVVSITGLANDAVMDQEAGVPAGNETATGLSLDEIGIELVNPVTSLVSFKTDFQYTFFQGSLADADGESAYVLNFQSSFPVPLSNGNNILIRLDIPLNGDQPLYEIPGSDIELSPFQIRQIASTLPRDGTFDHYHGHSHLGDIGMDVAYGGVSDSGLIGMFGIAAVLPTSQDISQRNDQALLGPEIALGRVTDRGIFGGWLTHLTGLQGDEAFDVNMTTLELFFAYSLGNGWQITSNPVLAYDWEGEKENRLFLPVGGGLAKTIRAGGIPLRLGFEVYAYAASPDAIGPDWMFTFNMTPAMRNPLLD